MKSLHYILVLLLTFSVGSTMYAQKIKLKKNEVLVDGVAIANYDGPGNYETVFTDLKDPSKKVKVTYTAYTKPGSETRNQWVTFKNADESLQSDVKLEDLIFSLNFRKSLAETMFKNYNILTLDGVDMEAFKSFMAVERPNLMDLYSAEKQPATVAPTKTIEDINIYGKKGLLITGDNELVEGVITMIFDDAAYQQSGKTVMKYNPEEEGQYVRIVGKKEGGDTSLYGAKSNTNARFCIDLEDGSKECYYGMELKASGFMGAVGAAFDASAFHKIVLLKESVVLVEDYESEGYAIKITSQPKGFLFNTNNSQKNIEKLSEYLDCDVSEFKDNNFKEEQTAKALVDFYLAQCGK